MNNTNEKSRLSESRVPESKVRDALRRHIIELTRLPRVPQSEGYFFAQKYIGQELEAMGYRPHRQNFNLLTVGTCTNIFAENSPHIQRPRILIGAHYDTRESSGPGADDNTSGVAVTLELARLLKDHPTHSFVFAFFDMEEIIRFGSLRGSRAFADFYPLKIEQAIILDTVGGNLMPGFEEIILQFGESLHLHSVRNLDFLKLPMVILEPMGKSFARSDYAAFRAKGIPFTFLTSGTPWYYHTKDDTIEVLHWEKLEKLTLSLHRSLLDPKTTASASVEAVHRFLRAIQAIPELQSSAIEMLIEKPQIPTRLEVIKMYAHILPRLRKMKRGLWKTNEQAPA